MAGLPRLITRTYNTPLPLFLMLKFPVDDLKSKGICVRALLPFISAFFPLTKHSACMADDPPNFLIKADTAIMEEAVDCVLIHALDDKELATSLMELKAICFLLSKQTVSSIMAS